MSRKESAEAKILRLFDSLSDEGKRIVFDLLRGKQQPVKTRKATASKRKSATPNTDAAIQELSKSTGKSDDDCKAALLASNGNKKAAMLALTGS